MINLVKPQRLKPGDKIATVSLSWGELGIQNSYGDIIWGKRDWKKNLA